MIVCTKSLDTLMRKAMGRNEVSSADIKVITSQISLDPALSQPVRDAYILSSDDVRNPKIREAFVAALATKHPNSRIIFIDKGSKPTFPDGLEGINMFLQKPRPADVTNAISTVLAEEIKYEIPDVKEEETIEEIPAYTAPEPTLEESEPEPEPEYVPEENINIEPEPEPEPEQIPVMEKDSELVKRIEDSRSVSDVATITREITASALIKDLIESNSTYAGIEEKLKGLNDAIFLVMNDTTIPTLDEKLSKTRALLHDKAFFASKGDTLIEQRLEEVVEAICSKTSDLLSSRLSEIDTAILKVQNSKAIDAGNARLAGLNEERINLILELRTLETEINNIYKSTDNLIISSVTSIAEKSIDITGNDVLNAHIRARGNTVVDDGTMLAIRAATDLAADKVTDDFKEMKLKVVTMIQLLDKLFDLDREIIAAQQQTINYLRAHKIEDTVIAETLLKKSMRVFIGEEGSGRTIIPYLLSYYKSRQNANVLLLDLTGTGKYASYGINSISTDKYFTDMNQQEFLVVSGSINDDTVTAQRIVSTLVKAADWYRVINIVLRPDQLELFDTIAQDALSTNYITDITPASLDNTRKLINETKRDNVARRLFLNRCDIPIRPVISRLGLDDSLDFQVSVVPTIPAITDANINGYNPYGISAVTLCMEDVLRHA